jgi:hypothetical protein
LTVGIRNSFENITPNIFQILENKRYEVINI